MIPNTKPYIPTQCPPKLMLADREAARLFPRQRRVALLADAPVSQGTMAQLIALCQRMTASLVVFAPADRALATSILEAFLPKLEQADIEWDIVPLRGDRCKAIHDYLTTHTEIELVACDIQSGLAQALLDGGNAGRIMPVPILMPLIVEPIAAMRPPEVSAGEIDWLRPDLNRGF